jgi:hypothetical protein
MTSNRSGHPLTRIGFLGFPLLLLSVLLLLVPTTSLQQQTRILYVNNADPTCQGQAPVTQRFKRPWTPR